MAFEPYRSGSLLIPFNDVPHLFAVMNHPCENRSCLLIMITSIKDNKYHDDACVLEVGDHEYITKASYLLYRMADTAKAHHISNMVGKNYYIQKEDFRDDIFNRIVRGLYASEETRPRIVRYAEDNGI